MSKLSWKSRTKAIHHNAARSQFGEVSEALFLTQGFVYDSAEAAEARFNAPNEPGAFIYARYGNPTTRMFEDRMAALEGMEDAFATASGMAAVSGALLALLKSGDHVVSSRALFGSCHYVVSEVLPKFGVEVDLIDGRDLDAWREAIRPDTKLVFLETISNPTLEVIDLKAVAKMAHAVGAVVVVDNAMCSPAFTYAKECGADLVIYSTTKHVDGQGRCLGGVIIGSKEMIRGPIEMYLKHTGGAISPFNAWVQLKALETLDLRVRQQVSTLTTICEAIADHPSLNYLRYPTHHSHPQFELASSQSPAAGTVFTLDFKGGKEAAFTFLNALNLVTLSNNFADAKSIATHPCTTTHKAVPVDQRETLGLSEGLVRVSIGLEDPSDLSADIIQALDKVGSSSKGLGKMFKKIGF